MLSRNYAFSGGVGLFSFGYGNNKSIQKDVDTMTNLINNTDASADGKEKCCCFTGHRFVKNEHKKRIEENLSIVINELIDTGVREFISGGALGFDMIAARAVLRIREKNPDIRLVFALPCVNHNRGWKRADIAEFERLAKAADEVIYVSKDYYDGCMLRRNRYMVDKSGHCIFYLNYPRGGTAYTIRYALAAELEMHNIMIPK